MSTMITIGATGVTATAIILDTEDGRRYPVDKRRRPDGYADREEDPYCEYDHDDDPYRGAPSR